jgi:hypothetical protein
MGKQLGIDGFTNFFKSTIYLSAEEIIESILSGVYQFSPAALKDDVYLILAAMK